MSNIVATGISSKLNDASKQTIRDNIGFDAGVLKYNQFMQSLKKKATLWLDFTNNEHKVYEQYGLTTKVLTDAITTTRASNATYDAPTGIATAAANIPRITYDPLTGVCLGLEVEEARTNLFLHNSDFANAVWLQSPDADVNVTSNVTIAPDGTLTADKFFEATTTNTFHDIFQNISYTAGVTYCFSCYVKAAERNRVRLAFGGTGAFTTERYLIADLVAKTVVPVGSSATGSIEELTNGWFRVWVAATADATGSTPTFIRLNDSSGVSIYPGVVNSGLFLWGAQIEAGAFPTSVIPTTTIAQARTVDGISRTVPTSREGTIICVCRGVGPESGRQQAAFTLSDGTQSNRVLIRRNASLSGTQYAVVSGDVESAGTTTPQKAAGVRNVFAISWRDNRFIASEDGLIVLNDTAGSAPINLTQLGIGSAGPGGSENLNGTIELIAMIPRALTAAELQQVRL
jgi:hypothetical protein